MRGLGVGVVLGVVLTHLMWGISTWLRARQVNMMLFGSPRMPGPPPGDELCPRCLGNRSVMVGQPKERITCPTCRGTGKS
jgi:hypothetical protein